MLVSTIYDFFLVLIITSGRRPNFFNKWEILWLGKWYKSHLVWSNSRAHKSRILVLMNAIRHKTTQQSCSIRPKAFGQLLYDSFNSPYNTEMKIIDILYVSTAEGRFFKNFKNKHCWDVRKLCFEFLIFQNSPWLHPNSPDYPLTPWPK